MTDRLLWRAAAATVLFAALEAAGGYWTGSLALLSDAGHMLTDALALGMALFALSFAARPATARKTYGFYRLEILCARQVAYRGRDVRSMLQPSPQTRQVLGIDVGCDVPRSPRRQVTSQVPGACAELEHLWPQVGPDRVGHPAVEIVRVRQGVQDIRPFALVDIG